MPVIGGAVSFRPFCTPSRPAAITAADRAFLGREWAYVELTRAALKTAHPGAREADRQSPFVLAAGATAVLNAIDAVVAADNRQFVVTLPGIVEVDFAQQTPNFTLYADRFGLSAGRTMICQRVDHNWSKMQTVLYLGG